MLTSLITVSNYTINIHFRYKNIYEQVQCFLTTKHEEIISHPTINAISQKPVFHTLK